MSATKKYFIKQTLHCLYIKYVSVEFRIDSRPVEIPLTALVNSLQIHHASCCKVSANTIMPLTIQCYTVVKQVTVH